MAWPPPVLATDKTNTLQQNNDHAAHHNAMALAINDVVARVGPAPLGMVAFKSQAADNAGHTSGFEWGVALDLTVPSTTGRKYLYKFALSMIATSAPVYPGTANAYVWYSCNVGDKSGPELAHWIIPTPQWDGGYNFFGDAIITPAPGVIIGAGIYFGSGAWTIRAGSYAALFDVGGS